MSFLFFSIHLLAKRRAYRVRLSGHIELPLGNNRRRSANNLICIHRTAFDLVANVRNRYCKINRIFSQLVFFVIHSEISSSIFCYADSIYELLCNSFDIPRRARFDMFSQCENKKKSLSPIKMGRKTRGTTQIQSKSSLIHAYNGAHRRGLIGESLSSRIQYGYLHCPAAVSYTNRHVSLPTKAATPP